MLSTLQLLNTQTKDDVRFVCLQPPFLLYGTSVVCHYCQVQMNPSTLDNPCVTITRLFMFLLRPASIKNDLLTQFAKFLESATSNVPQTFQSSQCQETTNCSSHAHMRARLIGRISFSSSQHSISDLAGEQEGLGGSLLALTMMVN